MGFITICTLASSSSGNCALVSQGDTHLLIDAGISLRRITGALKGLGLSPGELSGVFVTHEHSDHVCGLKMLIKYHGTPVYAPLGAARALRRLLPDGDGCLSFFEAGAGIDLGALSIRSFRTLHDTPESVGYRLSNGRASMVFVTDIGSVTREVLDAASGADLAVIEANHDVPMLKNGPYPAYLKRRILSERGHLSNEDSGALAARLCAAGTRTVVLAHLSRENNTPRLAREAVGRALARKGATVGGDDAGGDVVLDMAPPDEPGRPYIL